MSTMSNMASSEAVGIQGFQNVTDEMKYQLHQYQQHQHDFDVMDKQLESNKQLNAQMNRYQGESIMQQVSGLRNAGLSPALANGTMSTGGSGGSVGAPSTSTAPDHAPSVAKTAMESVALNNQIRLTNAQIDLMDSEATKNRSIAGQLDYELGIRDDQNKTIAAFAQDFARRVVANKNASDIEKSTASIFAKASGENTLNEGSLRGVQMYLDTYGYNFSKLADVIEDKLRAQYAGAFKKREFILLGKQIANLSANVTLLKTQVEDILPEEKKRIMADVLRIAQLRKAILHGDLIESYREDPTATMTAEGFKLARDIMMGIANGAAFGGGIKAAERVFGRPPKEPMLRERNVNTTRTNTTNSHQTSMELLYKNEF